MTERVSMINSNITQLNSDFDFSAALLHLFGGEGGVLFLDGEQKAEFKLQGGVIGEEGKLAKAIVVCTRQTSNPIPNEKFLAVFSLFGTKNIDTTNGNKIYIEIDKDLIADPTLIKDEGQSTDFAKGFGIGAIKSTPDYPTHPNYLPLYEVKSGGVIEDKRPPISLSDEVLKDSAFIANIINEINNIDQIIQQFETDGLPTAHLTEKHYCAEVITPGVNVGFLQSQPEEDNCIEAHNIGDVAANTKLFQKAYLNGNPLTYVDVIFEMFGASTQDVVVRIEKVDADGKPTGELIDPNAQTSISFGSIGAKGKVRASFTGITENTEGLACAVVCYIPIINSSNYYIRYADATQYSDGMAGGTNDGTTWTNNQAMLGCWSDGFAQGMMCRATTTKVGDKVKIGRMLYPSELTSVGLASNYFTLGYFKTSFPNGIYGIDGENIVSTNIKFFVFSVNAGFTKFIKNNIKYTEVSKSCTTGQTASYAFIAITDGKIKVNYHISASSYNMYYSRTYFNILQGGVNIYSDMVNPPTYGNTQTKDFSTEIDTFAGVEYKISVNNAVDSSASSGDGNFTAIIT